VTINFKRSKNLFFGKLKSSFEGCKPGRKVRLKKVKKGADPTVGKDTSGSDGSWSIKKTNGRRFPNGKYYAIAKPKTLTTIGGDQVDCQKGKSKTRKV
jgi:hypothetical protein